MNIEFHGNLYRNGRDVHRDVVDHWMTGGGARLEDIVRFYREQSDDQLASEIIGEWFKDNAPEWFDRAALIEAIANHRQSTNAAAITGWWKDRVEEAYAENASALDAKDLAAKAFRAHPGTAVFETNVRVPVGLAPLVCALLQIDGGPLYVEVTDVDCTVFRASDAGHNDVRVCRSVLGMDVDKKRRARSVLSRWMLDEYGSPVDVTDETKAMGKRRTSPSGLAVR